MITSYGNPFLSAPDRVSAGTLVSGGGGDGYIDHVVAFVLQRVVANPAYPVSSTTVPPGLRGFDLAELVAWACTIAGVPGQVPDQTDLLRAYCYRNRASLPTVAAGMGLKGALLFAPGSLGLSLGMRRRVVVHDLQAGVVVDEARVRRWDEAALIPGARGYR